MLMLPRRRFKQVPCPQSPFGPCVFLSDSGVHLVTHRFSLGWGSANLPIAARRSTCSQATPAPHCAGVGCVAR
eukprot:6860222-Pyramimonas_sp.AAC.1